jgi:predicted amino acid dehydrogenase
VGDGGITIAKALDIPVTTGDSYTIAVAVEAILKAANLMEIEPGRAVGAVVGATGAIGQVCAQLMARHVGDLLLIGRRKDALNQVKYLAEQSGPATVKVTTTIDDLRQADLIITVSSAVDAIIEADHLKSGAIECDVARPRDVARSVVEKRKDVLVIEGGMVEIPGPVNFNFDFGFPAKMAFACMAETILLALESRYESFTLGKEITLSQVEEISRLAQKHGLQLGGFRSFEKPVTDEIITRIKSHIAH